MKAASRHIDDVLFLLRQTIKEAEDDVEVSNYALGRLNAAKSTLLSARRAIEHLEATYTVNPYRTGRTQ